MPSKLWVVPGGAYFFQTTSGIESSPKTTQSMCPPLREASFPPSPGQLYFPWLLPTGPECVLNVYVHAWPQWVGTLGVSFGGFLRRRSQQGGRRPGTWCEGPWVTTFRESALFTFQAEAQAEWASHSRVP